MGYFKDIADSFSTIFEGLTITASHMFRRPITVQYPDRIPSPVKETLSPRYRGFLKADMGICTGCMLCQNACPIQCIEVGVAKQGEPPQRMICKFNIDIGKCMFCGLCVEVCPTGAVHFTREFEKAVEKLDELVFRFVEEGKPVVPYKKGA